jgi:O-antigen/teichoic acid export membrane protein
LIARKSFLVFLNMVVGAILGYIAMFFILRYMGPDDYGLIGFGLSIVGVFSIIAKIGFDSAHVKRVSEGQNIEACVGTFLVIKVVLIGIMVGAVFLGVFIWKYVLGLGFETPDSEPVIYIFILYYAVLAISAVPLATFSARRETAKQQLPGLLEPLIRVPVTIIVAVGAFGVFALAGAWLLGALALMITSFILFRGFPIGKFDRELSRKYIDFAKPIAILSSVGIFSTYVDKITLQLFWGSTYVGYYFGVQNLTRFLILIATAVTMLLFPTLSKHHSKEEFKEVRRLTAAAERYVSIVIMPIAVLFIVFPKPILEIFEASIAENAWRTMQIMTIYSVVFAFYIIFVNQIMGVDKPRTYAKVGVFIAILNIALNIILIPRNIKSLGLTLFGMGPNGAALATLISFSLGLVIVKIITRRVTGTKWNPRILLHIGAALVTGGILYFLSTIIVVEGAFVLGPVCLLGIGIYIGFLTLLREFTRDDFKLFLDILNPKGMKDYVFSELKDKNNGGEDGS